MNTHSHDFVETYDGPIAFGLDRETNENTVAYYAQKFTDDHLIRTLVSRMTDEQLGDLFDTISRVLRTHLSEDEYHRLFLKQDHDGR